MQRNYLLHLVFIICCVFIYAGVVNLGVTGVFWGLPFLFAAFIVVKKLEDLVGRIFNVFLVICFALYVLKHLQTKVFFPLLGEEIIAKDELCLIKRYENLYLKFVSNNECYGISITELDGDFYIKKGSSLRITMIGVESQDIGSDYYFMAETSNVRFRYSFSPESAFYKKNGEVLKKHDLVRGMFYWPSYLMFYPALPMILL